MEKGKKIRYFNSLTLEDKTEIPVKKVMNGSYVRRSQIGGMYVKAYYDEKENLEKAEIREKDHSLFGSFTFEYLGNIVRRKSLDKNGELEQILDQVVDPDSGEILERRIYDENNNLEKTFRLKIIEEDRYWVESDETGKIVDIKNESSEKKFRITRKSEDSYILEEFDKSGKRIKKTLFIRPK